MIDFSLTYDVIRSGNVYRKYYDSLQYCSSRRDEKVLLRSHIGYLTLELFLLTSFILYYSDITLTS